MNSEFYTGDLLYTVKDMLSDDYHERLRAEREQLEIRAYKLQIMLSKYDNDELEFNLSCPVELLREQLKAMEKYLLCLIQREITENNPE